MYNTNHIEEKIKNAVRECGEIMLSASDIKAEAKSGRRDLVTKYDRAVQERITALLAESYPNAGFIGEENDFREHIDSEICFIIDPIDGTANFSKHFGHSCISVACLIGGVPSVGVVYDPYLNELFSAVNGGGAYLNGKRIYVTEEPLAESIVIFGTSPYNSELTDITFEKLRRVFDKCLDLRRTGTAALDLCYSACGRCGAFFEEILALWDYAAGAIIVNEAGGVCMNMNGDALDYKTVKTSMISGSRRNTDELMSLFSK